MLVTRRALGVVVVSSALVLAACSGDAIEYRGNGVANAEEILAEADSTFHDVVAGQVDEGTATVADASQCFFHRAGEESIDTALYCGPVRELGGNDGTWYAIALEASFAADDEVSLSIPATETQPGPAPDGELFRPDGAEPIAASELDEPQAPPSPESDFAVLADTNALEVDAEFQDLEQPFNLRTPAADFTVEAQASLETVPEGVISLAAGNSEDDEQQQDAPEGAGVPYFRPADGQQVRAWQVTVASPPPMAPDPERETDPFSDEEQQPRDASTTLVVEHGSQRLTVQGSITNETESDTSLGFGNDDGDNASATVPCEAVQCPEINNTQYILIMSAAEGEDPSLIATVDGADQMLSLADGELTSELSQVAYSRDELSQQVSTTWGSTSVRVANEQQLDDLVGVAADEVTYTFGGQVQRAFLSPFDYTQGWAPQGKAWLTIPIANDPRELSQSEEVNIDWAQTWRLTTGDESLPSDPEATTENAAVFLVNDDFKEGTFVYSPTGSTELGYPGETFTIETDQQLTLDISFP